MGTRTSDDVVPIRVVIGDSDPSYREMLRRTLEAEPDILVVGEANEGQRALDLVRSLRPAVAVLADDMDSLGGGAVARVLASELPSVKVVIVGSSWECTHG